MTLKDELEILLGEPIKVFDGDPMDIPCIETSDVEKLCGHPVVSVHMITYNHEPYIRQAIEGVMMQKTDFEFELVIGEDASTDRTREICLEYQKKFPDKIRVLWWHENVSKLGGNGRRVMAHCRGIFIAFCEGDDYWIDPLKLQKQVDYVRETDAVMCVANSEWHYPDGHVSLDIYKRERGMLVTDDFLRHYFHTTTYLVNREVYESCKKLYQEIVVWYDCVLTVCMSSMGKICFLPDVMSVYNWTGSGVGGSPGSAGRDILLAFQFTQFAYCSNHKIAEHYSDKAIEFIFSNLLFSFSPCGYRHPKEMRSRALRTACRICRKRYGILTEQKLRIRFFLMAILTHIKIVYVRHPNMGKYWRRCKAFLHTSHSGLILIYNGAVYFSEYLD